MSKLEEKFMSDFEDSSVEDPVEGLGGPVKKRLADVKQEVDPEADAVEPEEFQESFLSLFSATDLTEDFKSKALTVFASAVHEQVTQKLATLTEELEEKFEAKLAEDAARTIDEITENLDSYLDYVVTEWMAENRLAVESGVKVEMAESLMAGLQTLFTEHNLNIDEETVDVVAELETKLEKASTATNKVIHENMALKEQLASLNANFVFATLTEDLTETQVERLKLLSERLNVSDLDQYKKDLIILKESFFKPKAAKETKSAQYLEEEVQLTETKSAPNVDPLVKMLADSIATRSGKN